MAARVLWFLAFASMLVAYVDSIALTRMRTTRAATSARLRLALAEAAIVAGAIVLHVRLGEAGRLADPPSEALAWIGGALAIASASLAIAGKRALGRWFTVTANLAIKEGHVLITSGPYRWVRHPIYLAAVSLSLATALVWNSWAFLGMTVALLGAVGLQLRREERVMIEGFGASYEDYRDRVPGVFPWPRPGVPRPGVPRAGERRAGERPPATRR
jgi:protein-S-isoprenylcysteine O-methyltransferase Ste14